METFEEGKMETQLFIIENKIFWTQNWLFFFFCYWKHTSECDEMGHKDCVIQYEIKRKKSVKGKLSYALIVCNPNYLEFNIFKVIK